MTNLSGDLFHWRLLSLAWSNMWCRKGKVEKGTPKVTKGTFPRIPQNISPAMVATKQGFMLPQPFLSITNTVNLQIGEPCL